MQAGRLSEKQCGPGVTLAKPQNPSLRAVCLLVSNLTFLCHERSIVLYSYTAQIHTFKYTQSQTCRLVQNDSYNYNRSVGTAAHWALEFCCAPFVLYSL